MYKWIGNISLFAVLLILVFGMTGCTEAERVSYNVSNEADNFNVCRKITVINLRTDTVLYEFEGFSSISVDSEDNQLEIVSEVDRGQYKKDFISLPDEVCYTVTDISGPEINKYHYEWTILPFGIDVKTD